MSCNIFVAEESSRHFSADNKKKARKSLQNWYKIGTKLVQNWYKIGTKLTKVSYFGSGNRKNYKISELRF